MAESPVATESSPPDLQRNVRIFGLTSLLNDTATEMAYWILPAFLISLGAGPAALGLIEGIAESVASFAKLFSGMLADRVARRKPVVVTGYAVANAVKPFLALATVWWQVLLIRFCDRLAKGVRGAPRDVMVAESVREKNVGSAFGLLQAMDSAGAFVGPLAALLLLGAGWSMRGVFWVASVPGLLCVIVVAMLVRETGERTRTSRPASRSPGSSTIQTSLLPPSFYYLLAAVALFSLGNSSDMFLILRAQTIGIPVRHAPLLGLAFNLTYTALSWPAGRLSDRTSRQNIAAAGYVIFAVVYLVFAAAPSRAAIWGAMAFYGCYYALTQPVLRAMVVDEAPREARGRAFGIFYFVTSLTTLAASVLAGELWKHAGPQSTFRLSAILAMVSALLLLFARNKPQSSLNLQ
jgi:MFS family permease